jgi:hypothetical protein
MKHIVIPTDFSIRSLKMVNQVVEHFGEEELAITLLHGMHLPSSIVDLLFLGKKNEHSDMINEEFRDACEILQNKYASVIPVLKVQFMYGNTRRVMKNFLEANKTDLVVLPENYTYRQYHENSVDLVPLLQKTGYPLLKIKLQPANAGVEKEMVADLLLAG